MKISIRSWTGVATWRWVANDDTCGICRLAFDGCCPDCKLPGDDCPLAPIPVKTWTKLAVIPVLCAVLGSLTYHVFLNKKLFLWGQCSHCFHIHCIMKWLHSQQVNHQCPMCRQEWKFKE